MAPTILSVESSVLFIQSLTQDSRLYNKITTGVYAIPDHNEQGLIQKFKFRIVQHLNEESYVCSCNDDKCFHVKAAETVYPRYGFQDEETEGFKNVDKICQLSYDADEERRIIGVYSETTDSFGIIRYTKKQIKCLSCTRKPLSCDHRQVYIGINPQANISILQP